MGCQPSKLRNSSRKRDLEKQEDTTLNVDASDCEIVSKYDKETISAIKRDLYERPEMFVLNNVLMCSMFLENYEKDIKEAVQNSQGKDYDVVQPDVVMEIANKNVIYRPFHGPKKGISEPLVTRRLYVPVNEHIEVFNTLDDTESITPNPNKYQVKMEETKRKGYVKLRSLKASGIQLDENSIKDILVVPSSSASGSSDTESSDYMSGENGSISEPQLIRNQQETYPIQDCFVYRKVKKPDIDLEIEDMDHEHLTDDDVYDIVSYLTSRRFMMHFQRNIFQDNIAKKIGFIQYEIDNAVVDPQVPGKIFCNFRDGRDQSYPVEVLPCLKIAWPENQTLRFLMRKPYYLASDDDFLWPTQEMLNNMRHFECTLVPRGYSRKREKFPEGDLEWEIHFPLAERYLTSLLRPEQIKCYLVLLTLYKEYIEPFTKDYGITPDHLRTVIFWESEIDSEGWPGHRLGNKLLNIIQHLATRLRQRALPDYFIEKKNLFKNASRKYLEYANEIFHRITQSPSMLIIRALRNLRYKSGHFYPPLDYKQLLDILYKTNWEDTNSLLVTPGIPVDQISISSTTTKKEKKPRFNDAEKQLQYVKEMEKRKQLLQKINGIRNAKSIGNLNYTVKTEARRISQDSVNDEWECERRFDVQKKIALLKFFINNLLNIAKTSFKISSKRQTLFYLKQARYLTKILQEENRLFEEEVKDLFKKIKEQEDECIKEMIVNNIRGNIKKGNNNVTETDCTTKENFNSIADIRISATITGKINLDIIQQQVPKPKMNIRAFTRSLSDNYYPNKINGNSVSNDIR